MYRLIIALALFATVSQALPTNTTVRMATEGYVTNKVAAGVAAAVAQAGTNTTTGLSSKVSTNDATYLLTVLKAASALQVQTQQVYVAAAGTAVAVTGSQSNLIASASQPADLALKASSGIANGLSVRDPTLALGVDANGAFATITPSPAGQIEYWFNNALVQYGNTATVRLTAGTTNAPSLNYICALPTGVITNYTSYPYLTSGTSSDARAIMFEVFLMDTNSIANGSGYAMRSWTDNDTDRRGLGRISWIGERVRRLPAIWESGVQASLLPANTAATNYVANAYVATTTGVGWQMHSHTIPTNTLQQMWLINSTQGFRTITNLAQITMAPDGSAILVAAGDCFAVNVFAFVESGITPKQTRIMLTSSTDDYISGTTAVKLANCIADASSFDVTGVPVWMQGMTIRIARIVMQRNTSGTDRRYFIYDRRGQPLGTSGGGSSSSGESDPVYAAAYAAGLLTSASSTSVSFTPTNYTASAQNVEAHLGGIDNKLTGVVTNGQDNVFLKSVIVTNRIFFNNNDPLYAVKPFINGTGFGGIALSSGGAYGTISINQSSASYGFLIYKSSTWVGQGVNGITDDYSFSTGSTTQDFSFKSANFQNDFLRIKGSSGLVTITSNLTVSGISRIILPTSTNGLASGTLWNNGGNVQVQDTPPPAYIPFTSTITPANGTATVVYAHGNMPSLTITSATTITLDPTSYGTSGVSRVSLNFYSGTNSVTLATNVITYATTPTISTNAWNTILIRRVSDSAWKGVGL